MTLDDRAQDVAHRKQTRQVRHRLVRTLACTVHAL
uniref:Uncharacterized protein n=1 Tax=Anopheles arabiensis TaxID=7173 RepID=A0A182IF39_ANOAR